MDAIIDIAGGGNSSAYICFKCANCGFTLVDMDDSFANLVHPTHDGIIFKGKPIDCEYAGVIFKKPTIKLQAI